MCAGAECCNENEGMISPGDQHSGNEPRRILQLPQAVIDRIAAGEVVLRPVHALKELVENALDAGSSCIQVSVREGGMRFLQVCDDGSGIARDDLALACKRFATSKLRSYKDIYSVSSMGFRGEALASISHSSQSVVITSSCRNQSEEAQDVDSLCAYRACYSAGACLSVEPCAGNPGTSVSVLNLFHRAPARLACLASPSAEHAKLVDLLSRLAVHHAHVGFTLRKLPPGASSTITSLTDGENNGDSSVRASFTAAAVAAVTAATSSGAIGANYDINTVNTVAQDSETTSLNQTRKSIIRRVYGFEVANHLLHISSEHCNQDKKEGEAGNESKREDKKIEDSKKEEEGGSGRNISFEYDCWFTSPGYSTRKFIFILYINNRLVGSTPLRRAVESAYSALLLRGTHPWVYLSLTVPHETVDVNIHPTKHEVRVINEAKISSIIRDAVTSALHKSNSSRSYQVSYSQPTFSTTINSSSPASSLTGSQRSHSSLSDRQPHASSSQGAAFVRTDFSQEKLDRCRGWTTLTYTSSKKRVSFDLDQEPSGLQCDEGSKSEVPVVQLWREERTKDSTLDDEEESHPSKLDSVQELILNAQKSAHQEATSWLARHSYVGRVEKTLVLLQSDSRLLLCDLSVLLPSWVYWVTLKRIGEHKSRPLANGINLSSALENATKLAEPSLDQEEVKYVSETVKNQLVQMAPMLGDYFGIAIEQVNGHYILTGLPEVVETWWPYDIAQKSNRTTAGPEDKEAGAPAQVGHFLLRLGTEVDWQSELSCIHGIAKELSTLYCAEQEILPDEAVERCLFPVVRDAPVPVGAETGLTSIASLQELYKVFERC